MRTDSQWFICLAVAFIVTGAGCADPSKRLNAPPQGAALQRSDMQDQYTFMVDNAMLYDMSVADVHFIPHRPEINSLGVRRLSRYVQLLKDHGGTIHLETASPDDQLTSARIANVNEFLWASGLEETDVAVKAGLPRGRRIDAVDAIRIKQEGTVDDHGSDSQSSSGS